MTFAAGLLRDLKRADATRPRLTAYDDTTSPAERVELSARVLDNWVAKAANLLQDEGVEPGAVVTLDAPPHWRTAYWAFAVWSVGATLALGREATAQLVVSTDVETVGRALHDCPAVLLTLPALVRAAAGAVPDGAIDEAKDLATYPDLFAPWARPSSTDAALVDGERTAYERLAQLAVPCEPGARVHTGTADTGRFLRILLGAYAAGGSVVLSRGRPDEDTVTRRLREEGVTLDLG